LIWHFYAHFVIGGTKATHKHGVAIVVKNAFKRYFIYQRTTNPKRFIRMKMCQSINSIGLPVNAPS
jgi:hypothetical protein